MHRTRVHFRSVKHRVEFVEGCPADHSARYLCKPLGIHLKALQRDLLFEAMTLYHSLLNSSTPIPWKYMMSNGWLVRTVKILTWFPVVGTFRMHHFWYWDKLGEIVLTRFHMRIDMKKVLPGFTVFWYWASWSNSSNAISLYFLLLLYDSCRWTFYKWQEIKTNGLEVNQKIVIVYLNKNILWITLIVVIKKGSLKWIRQSLNVRV